MTVANEEQLAILEQGVEVWNKWRQENPLEKINLSEAYLCRLNLSRANLNKANLFRANLSEAFLMEADLIESNLIGAYLSAANLSRATLDRANLNGANLSEANFNEAKLPGAELNESTLYGASLVNAELVGANLKGADLSGTNFRNANLSGAHLRGAVLNGTVFANVDFSNVRSLGAVEHLGPSSLGIDTLLLFGGSIPDSFLEGCGVPDLLIDYLPSLLGKPIDFFSCFISYSHEDEDFCKRLHSRMRDDKLRVWYAPEDIKGGKKIHDQIQGAIKIHDKLLIVLSETSMESEWVKTEIRHARKREAKEGRQVLFPIRLVSMEAINDWTAFDADIGKDMAVEIREYHIPDFTNWKDHDSFEKAYQRLMKDFKPTPE